LLRRSYADPRRRDHDVKLTQDFLGHESSQTTLDHYIRRDETDLIAGMEKAAWGSDDDE